MDNNKIKRMAESIAKAKDNADRIVGILITNNKRGEALLQIESAETLEEAKKIARNALLGNAKRA